MQENSSSTQTFPRTILVGVDSEGRSENAVEAAIALAERFHARIDLVHAVPEAALRFTDGGVLPVGTLNEEAVEAIRARVHLRLRDLLPKVHQPGLEPRVEVIAGPPAKALLDRAREIGADLIVLGAHRRRGVFDFGSTARAVLAKLPAAVWVQVEKPRPIRNVLVPIDLSDESLQALARARDLAREFGARLTVLHCFVRPELAGGYPSDVPMPGPQYVIEDVRRASRVEFDAALARFDWRGIAHDARFEECDPTDRILEMQKDFDLIVLGTHGRTGLSAVILGNVAYSVLRESHTPVLAIRSAEREFLT